MNKIADIQSRNIDASLNLKKFILAKKSQPTALLTHNTFEQNGWYVKHIGQKGSGRNYIYFAQPAFNPKGSTRNKNNPSPAPIPPKMRLSEPFNSFAKAILISLHDSNPSSALHLRIVPLRYLEGALIKNNGDSNPTSTTDETLDYTVSLFKENYGMEAAYSYASQLQLIYSHMVELNLVSVPTDWRSSLPPKEKRRARVGKKFDDERAKKLPSPAGINALAEIFNSTTKDPAAIFGSSVCALMLCAPDRISEVLFAPVSIIAPDWTDPETGEIGTGLRWFPVKGAAPLVKTVIPSMRDVAVEAVERLKALSAPARNIALWYEKNPTKIFLPAHLEHLRNNLILTSSELFSVLFGCEVRTLNPHERDRIKKWLKANKIASNSHNYKKFNFRDIEKAVLKLLPSNFPIMDESTGMKYSEALCIAQESQFRSNTPFSCIFRNINFSTISRALKSTQKNRSLFHKLGYCDENGEIIQMTSHQFRHYLDTLVRHSSGLSEEEIAKWAGRKRTTQNSTYNHQSDRDIIAKLKDALGDPTKAIGPFGDISQRNFITRDEFANIKIITAHTSEQGYCIHDYTQSPCQAHQNCTDCDEHICIKGDLRAEKNIRASHAELLRLQEEARKAFSAEVLGSAEWFKYQTHQLQRVSELLAIIDDPSIPAGAVIQLNNEPYTNNPGINNATRLVAQDTDSSNKIRSMIDIKDLLNSSIEGQLDE